METVFGVFVLVGLLWLAYKVGRIALKVVGFVVTVLVGIFLITLLFGTLLAR